jgi:ribosomal protein S18 acetylase RimI-like enzyme
MLTSHVAVRVRNARLADAPVLADIFRRSWLQSYAAIIPHQHLERMVLRRRLAWWRTAIRSRDGVVVLEFDGRAVGYATCGLSRGGGAYAGEIFELYLLPEYQGLGFGDYLFEACRHRLDNRSLRGLVIWCLAENEAAISFYRRQGGLPVASCYERLGGARLEKIAFGWDD